MRMLMTVIDNAKKEEFEVFLERSGIEGYTEIPRAAGRGLSGRREGSRAFPRTSAVFFTVLTEEAETRLVAGVDEFCATCGEKLRMLSWPIDVVR